MPDFSVTIMYNLLCHPFENKKVKWHQHVPVDPPPQPFRSESSRLPQYRRRSLYNPKLQPGLAGNLHLCKQQEPPLLLVSHKHTPKIERIARVDHRKICATPSESDTRDLSLTIE